MSVIQGFDALDRDREEHLQSIDRALTAERASVEDDELRKICQLAAERPHYRFPTDPMDDPE